MAPSEPYFGKVSEQKILVVGAAGMLGHALYMTLQGVPGFSVYGTVRDCSKYSLLKSFNADKIVTDVDVESISSLREVIAKVAPDVVINCIGMVKHVSTIADAVRVIRLNTLFPHELAQVCAAFGARMVHISTDCVFDGQKGQYGDDDLINARDIYGLGKFLGEVSYPNTVTLRTSIIGHELGTANSLVEWILRQQGVVSGFRNAVFSGLTTYELARVIKDFVLPSADMSGVYHVSSAPISKFELLHLVSKIYACDLDIQAQDEPRVNRSLNSERFRQKTGYSPPSWLDLIQTMYTIHKENYREINF